MLLNRIARMAAVGLFALSAFFVIGCHQKPHYVTLTWKAPQPVPGVTIKKYNIYRSTTQGGPYALLVSGVEGLTYDDHLVNPSRTYYYVVRSLDQQGKESKNSVETRAVIP
jgi:predicted phage tail protein